MNGACMEFCQNYMYRNEVFGRRIIDVGSTNMNGSFRTILGQYEPKEYLGVDLSEGEGVDEICNAENLIEKYGDNSFDIVVSAEMLEHAKDWKSAIHNMKTILKPNGIIMLTARSYWFPYHGCPEDFWRFESEDMIYIFSDFKIKAIIPDYFQPGIFVKAIKPENWEELDLSNFEVVSIADQKPEAE